MRQLKNPAWILALALCLSSLAKAGDASPCAACDASIKTTQTLRALQYGNSKDDSTGEGLAYGDVFKHLDAFSHVKASDKNRIRLFKLLLEESRESIIYEQEGVVSISVGDLIAKDAKLMKEYASYLKSLPHDGSADACKTTNMQMRVDTEVCSKTLGRKGNPMKSVDACNQKYMYDVDDCMKKTTGHSVNDNVRRH